MAFVGKEVSAVSPIPHETREIIEVENINFENDGHQIDLTLLDMPGIASQVDWKTFTEHGLGQKEALQRAREATRGVVDAIKYLENVDVAVVVMDATRAPFDQVNFTIIGNIEHQRKPLIVVANKIDLPDAQPDLIQQAFADYPVVPMSALEGKGMGELYDKIVKVA